MTLRGHAHKYGDNIDTDAIIPARYLDTTDERELASHCLEDLDPAFVAKVRPGDIVVAGENFGCGSSREHAPLAIKGAGVSCVIAASFARIFFRNAINIGLPVLICPRAAEETSSGDELEVDLGEGRVSNLTRKLVYQTAAFPKFLQEIIDAGGLIPYTRRRLKQ
jgi:3-isopropylmalate/(R)-2-methylmalate dehydratase small subunit